jgi:hypothetical protein
MIVDYESLLFLNEFPKAKNDLYIVFEMYTFDNLFKLLLKSGFDHEEAREFMIANCNFSALVFQDRIHNQAYRKISTKNILNPEESSRKAKLVADLLEIIKYT